MEQILNFIKERPDVLQYFPAEEEIPKAGKEWVVNMLQTLCQTEFQAWVRRAEQSRKEKIDLQENRNVRAPSGNLFCLDSRSCCLPIQVVKDDTGVYGEG